MKAWKKFLVGAVVGGALLVSALVPSCQKQHSNFYILDEWAVMEGCTSSSNFSAKGVPKLEMIVKQPVVYIRSESEMDDLDLRFELPTISSRNSVLVYPQASVSESAVEWNNVKVFSSINKVVNPAKSGNSDLDALLDVLGETDSNILSVGSTRSKFLFYEAELKFSNPVRISYDNEEVRIRNIADYTLENLVFSAEFPTGESPIFGRNYFATAAKLNPGEELVLKLSENAPEYSIFKDDLIRLGFSEREADAFVNTWASKLLNPGIQGRSAQLTFRIPEKEYDKIIPLKANPVPKDTNRAMYVLLDAGSCLKPSSELYEKYAQILPAEALALLRNPDSKWQLAADPDYKKSEVTCEACGWICYSTPVPFEYVISGDRGDQLEIRIRNVQCFGRVPIFYYNSKEFRPSLSLEDVDK
ncbi:MAG: hypothetical protein QXW07_02515 [Candidatus Woesearchaeota archaeon]